ncbi:TraM recognition domain-containing protein [Paenarthrobacter sp. Z7-10]|uniref:type IV secretory system conjugative DNA transfer family protein n=1 Tax=Paenarthrobacter sp. Z7-10 TaxID=2787635 RepID=UPI0022A9C6C1|nr:type IV secretory system conjugative DNA transfer family protein [Paenarthrobacter sp. Z7-10]MCZ2404391.1 TraM recognition domain-containing protein [Paenarthrobacter sp. Z7-10]
MSAPNRKGTGTGDGVGIWLAIGAALVLGGGVWVSARLGSWWAGIAAPPSQPIVLIAGLVKGRVPWPVQSTIVGCMLLGVLVALAVAVLVVRSRSARKLTRVDKAAVHMGRGKDLNHLSTKGATATAVRLGVENSPGVRLGRSVAGKRPLWASWEDMLILIAGPRTMKTTSYAVPAILDAPGAVIATSNKRDIVDITRPIRAQAGAVWVFDPQAVAEEDPTWWWNPLSYVKNEATAANMAQHFANGSREPGTKPDAYFDPAGQNLLKAFLLAASLNSAPITQVYIWLTRPHDETPAELLKAAGFDLLADMVMGHIREPEKQRAGVYGTARQMVSCLTDRDVSQWVTPLRNTTVDTDPRPQFVPEDFVRGKGTLYSLSREGVGTAGPLVTALTVAVVEAAEKYATSQPGGRLVTPLLGILDEAANVCRWKALPDQYSHYGSRGIILMTILQSWSQGVEVWSLEGMRKLWSASNMKIYGGGVSEVGYLDELSRLIGQYSYINVSRSHSRQGSSSSRQENKDEILSVADLTALPRFRAILLASGAPAILIETIPWMNGPHAQKVTDAVAAQKPRGRDPVTVSAHNLWTDGRRP